MNKINNAIHELHTMADLANRNPWINQIHPLVKLLLTMIYIVTVVSFSKYALIGLLGFILYPVAIFIIGELSFKDALYRLRIVLPVVCFIGIFNPIFDKTPIFSVGFFTITTGWLSFFTLMIKGIFTVLASYLLIATTSIEKICYALRLLHIPSILVTQILLTYRYLTVLLKEAGTITDAYSLRAPGQKGVHYKVWGPLLGQLLLRSMDRAATLYESMCLRGFRGEFPIPEQKKCGIDSYFYFFFWCILFFLFRKFEVLSIIGGFFL